MTALGIVAIGRNEGERLRICLESALAVQAPVVYVDSGSSDGSVALAHKLGVSVLRLDPSRPFTAGRARREGFQKLLEEHRDLAEVFFVDGDCEVVSGWLETAQRFFRERPEVGAVCGRRRERFPQRSMFNRICDFEWSAPAGACLSVGGDSLFRVSAYLEAGEFNPRVPAGEEPELCLRLRAAGWLVWRLDEDMTTHDAAMIHWSQWWKRNERTGYGGYDVERRFALGMFDRLIRGAYVWSASYAAALTTVVAVMLLVRPWWSGLVVAALAGLLWTAQAVRVARHARRRGVSWRGCCEIGGLTMLSKVPIAFGAVRGVWAARRGEQARIIEYKRDESVIGGSA